MPVDRLVQQVLDRYDTLGIPPLNTLTPAEARQQPTLFDAAKALLQERGEGYAPEKVGDVADQHIPGHAGEIPIRIYHPKSSGPFPLLVYFHSGGWVLGDLDAGDAACRALTNMAHCLVVSVDYRKAPEHKFPAAVEDA